MINVNEFIYPSRREIISFIPEHFYVTERVSDNISMTALSKWIVDSLSGSWSFFVYDRDGETYIRLGFESETDLLFFNLGDGFSHGLYQGR